MIGVDPKHVCASADKTLWLLLLTDLQVPLRPVNLTTADLPLGTVVLSLGASHDVPPLPGSFVCRNFLLSVISHMS
jgi:hypothetical protein